MLEEHVINEIEAIGHRDQNEVPLILIQGREPDTRIFEKILTEKKCNFILASNTKAFVEALLAASSPVVVVILQKQIASSIARPLAAACDRLQTIYILRINSSLCIDSETKEIGIRLEYDHPTVSESPSAINTAEQSKKAFPIENIKYFFDSINKPADSNEVALK